MSNIDKQALRTAAENATPGEWCTDDYHGVIADAGLNANYYIASCSGPDNRHNKRFIAAANPATVLALLDELEAKDKLNAELMEKQRLIDICQGQGLEHRIAAEKRAEAAEKRTVEMPTFGGYVPHVARELQAAFRTACDNAGINVAVAGKGE